MEIIADRTVSSLLAMLELQASSYTTVQLV